MSEIGLDIKYSTHTVQWHQHKISMKERGAIDKLDVNDILFEENSESTVQRKLVKLLDNDYAQADLQAVVNECHYLTMEEKRSLLKLMQKYKDLFAGKLGTWNCPPVSFELKPNAKPWHGCPHTPPKAYEAQTRKECE